MMEIPDSILVTLILFNFSLIFLFKTALVLLTCIFCLQSFIEIWFSSLLVHLEKMDPEDSSEYEDDEEEDDDLMLFILPALYLASTGIGTLDQRSMVSDGTAIETPSQVSKFNDAEWICKVLEDDRGQGYDKLRVEPHILLELSRYLRSNDLLRNTRGVSVEEKIGMFIYMLSRNASFQKLNDRFKYSTETIHRHIKACFDAVTPMTAEFVKTPLTQAHQKISSDTRYWPYLEVSVTFGHIH